jgi:hypothetical protein
MPRFRCGLFIELLFDQKVVDLYEMPEVVPGKGECFSCQLPCAVVSGAAIRRAEAEEKDEGARAIRTLPESPNFFDLPFRFPLSFSLNRTIFGRTHGN